MSYSDSINSLKELIDDLESDLKRYAIRTDASERYIQRQNIIIGRLVDIYNGIDLPHPEAWIEISSQMDKLKASDKQIQGFMIILAENPKGQLAYIQSNKYVK